MISEPNKIKVTVVTGFLGAGKTSFINQILKANSEIQFALVENEFGDIAIDTKLIKGIDASQMFEMREGCICCTITDEYELVLQELAERFPNVQHLLIETTGVAEPVPVIRPFYTDEQLKKIYQFNGTVCLVDAINFDILPNKEIALKQIAAGDCVLVNKSDAVDSDKRHQIELKIKEVNPLADIYISEFGDANGFNLNSMNKIIYIPGSEKRSAVLLDTKTMVFEKSLYVEDFKERFSYLLDINKTKIYRVKGILNFADEPYEYILQGVGGSFELTESENLKSSDKSQIVLIGRLKDADFTM